MPKIETGMRARIAEFLPCALQKAIASYETFMEKEHEKDPEKDPKNDPEKIDKTQSSAEFKIHHDACKVALAHIELLVKLARWADLPDPAVEGENHHRVLQTLIEQAKGEIDE